MDTRIGYPNEHLAGDSDEEVASPMYATAVGLVMNAIERQQREAIEAAEEDISPNDATASVDGAEEAPEQIKEEVKKERKSVFEKFFEKLNNFLENAE